MTPLQLLMSTDALPGKVAWIGLRSARRAALTAVQMAEIDEEGLRGDHSRAGKRAVTLFQSEHLPVISSFIDKQVVPADLRRNIHISGLNLSALRAERLCLGAAILEITGLCAPCSRMSEVLGAGGYNALRGHGGWCARVVTPGRVALGDVVKRVAVP